MVSTRWGEAPSRVVGLDSREEGLDKAATSVDKLAGILVHDGGNGKREQ